MFFRGKIYRNGIESPEIDMEYIPEIVSHTKNGRTNVFGVVG